MFAHLLAFALLGGALASVHHFTWQDCDADVNRPLKIASIDVSPMPIVIPGPLTFSFSASLGRAVEGGKVELSMERKVPLLGYIHVPCILGIGSCPIDFCNELHNIAASSNKTRKAHSELKQILEENHINFTCPIQPQSASVSQATVHIKDLGSVASVLAAGDYKIKATIKDKHGAVVGCVSMKVELKTKHHGFLFR